MKAASTFAPLNFQDRTSVKAAVSTRGLCQCKIRDARMGEEIPLVNCWKNLERLKGIIDKAERITFAVSFLKKRKFGGKEGIVALFPGVTRGLMTRVPQLATDSTGQLPTSQIAVPTHEKSH